MLGADAFGAALRAFLAAFFTVFFFATKPFFFLRAGAASSLSSLSSP
jgi:hypothetical protein